MFVGRRRFVALLPLLGALAAALSQAAEPPAKPSAEAQQLIGLLGHVQHDARTKAQDDLEKLGPSVLPQLYDVMKKPLDPEPRRRLQEVIDKLETMGSLKATRITLKVADQPVRKIVEELARQSGYKIEIWPPGGAGDERDKRLLSLDLKEVTFWQAMQLVCDQGGLIFQEGWYGNDNVNIRLQMGDAFPGYFCNEGPFRIVARSMNYYRNLDLGGQRNSAPDSRRNESLNLTLSITVEPRLPLYGVGQPTITEALDDLDQSLKLQSQAGAAMRPSYYGGGFRAFMQQVSVTLDPKANGRRIKSLKGTIPVTLIALQRPKIMVDLKEWGTTETKPPKAGAKEEPKDAAKPSPLATAPAALAPLATRAVAAGPAAPPGPAAAGTKETAAGPKSKSFKSGSTTLSIEDVTKNGNQVTLKLSVTEASRGQQDYSWVNTVIQRIEVQDDKGVKLQSFSSSWGMNGQSVQGTFTYGGNGGNAGAPAKLVYFDWITLSHDVPFAFQDLPLP